MNCADLEALLCDYVDGTLAGSAAVRASVESHLETCASCHELVEDARAATAFLKRAGTVEPPAELITRILFHAPMSRAEAPRKGGLRAWLGGWLGPVLQPRFAMGMAMTILSFSMLGKFAHLPQRQLTPSDLHPAKVMAAIEDKVARTWDRAVKYYENLRLVYEIQSRLREWTEQEEQERRSQPAGALEPRQAEPGKAAPRAAPIDPTLEGAR
jgi:hypothetical protein